MGNNAQFMILDILLRDKYTTMKKIATEIGISVRSVERNIMELVIRGVPICTKKGRNGGVYIEDVYNAKTPFFSEDDIKAIGLLVSIGDYIFNFTNKEELLRKVSLLNPCGFEILKDIRERYFSVDLPKMEKIKKGQGKGLKEIIEAGKYVNIWTSNGVAKVVPIRLVLREDGVYIYCYSNSKYIIIHINAVKEIVPCDEEIVEDDIVWGYSSERVTEIIK